MKKWGLSILSLTLLLNNSISHSMDGDGGESPQVSEATPTPQPAVESQLTMAENGPGGSGETVESQSSIASVSLPEGCPLRIKRLANIIKNRQNRESVFILFIGTSGSGKTTLAERIAEYAGLPYSRLTPKKIKNTCQFCVDDGFENTIPPLINRHLETDGGFVLILDEISSYTKNDNGPEPFNEGATKALTSLFDEYEKNPAVIFIATANNIDYIPDVIQNRFVKSTFYFSEPNLKLIESVRK